MLPSVFWRSIFSESCLLETWFFLQSNVFTVAIFIWIEGMIKTIIFLNIINKAAAAPSKTNQSKKIILIKFAEVLYKFSQYSDHYYFFDFQELASDFLKLFQNVFTPQPDLRRVRFKCSFTTINLQPAPPPGYVEITDSRF